jgi:hypothetical protein
MRRLVAVRPKVCNLKSEICIPEGDHEVRALVVPVKHTLTVTPEG